MREKFMIVLTDLNDDIDSSPITDTNSEDMSSNNSEFSNIIIAPSSNNSLTGGAGADILIGSQNNETLEGGAGNDIITGLGGNDDIFGGQGKDTLSGGGISITNNRILVTEDTSGIDNLTGGLEEDVFVLGGKSSSNLEEATTVIHYDTVGNDDYGLITDFDKSEDLIQLGGSIDDYRLGSSPSNLPTGTAIYREEELVAIVQGSSDLSLSDNYFQFTTA